MLLHMLWLVMACYTGSHTGLGMLAGGFDSSVNTYSGLLNLARSQGAITGQNRGACKKWVSLTRYLIALLCTTSAVRQLACNSVDTSKEQRRRTPLWCLCRCGQLGHLTKQCKNEFSRFYGGVAGPSGGFGPNGAASAAAAVGVLPLAAPAGALPPVQDGGAAPELSSDLSDLSGSDSDSDSDSGSRKRKVSTCVLQCSTMWGQRSDTVGFDDSISLLPITGCRKSTLEASSSGHRDFAGEEATEKREEGEGRQEAEALEEGKDAHEKVAQEQAAEEGEQLQQQL